jgi:phosphatidylglycerol---prolipoprotein diacylglyceryl transferase
VDPLLVQIGAVRFWYYGLAYAIGLLTIHLWVYARREHLGYDRRDVAWFSVFFAAGVLIGGRLFDVVFYEWFYYGEHPWQILRPWEGGMATHGVLLGAVVGTALFCRLRNKNLLAVADEVVIPGAALMALGRVGNHINGEVYGSVTSVAWAMGFPYAEGCRHPVALYDGAKNLLIVPILLAVKAIYLRRNGHLPRGILLGHFVFWYAFLRLFVDLFREYDSYWLGVGRGQYFNLIMAAAGMAIIVAARRYARRKTTDPERASRTLRRDFAPSWAPAAVFYALVALCLTIPSGWTQQVLEDFEARAGAWSGVDESSPFSRRDDDRGRGERGRRSFRRNCGPGRADARRLAGDAGHGRASGGRCGELGRERARP